MKTASYILSAKHCLSLYNGTTPFAIWLKQYFREHKKFGSRDRKIIAHLCFCFFRLGKAFKKGSVEEQFAIGLFLSSKQKSKELEELSSEWNEAVCLPLPQKLNLLNAGEEWKNIFPFASFLSPEIEEEAFVVAHLTQPDLFLRVRPGGETSVRQKLTRASISYKELSATCLALPNGSKVEEVLLLNEEAVVQDVSSQKVLSPLDNFDLDITTAITAWDCCAASGGKSILLFDLFPAVQLTVSDVRSSILHHLHARFQKAGITNYKSFVADVSAPQFTTTSKFDLVICDAPCSGSGTWSRTPENLSFFKKDKIEYYSNLQKWIVVNAAKGVKKGGAFLYITCSVFTQENEEVVEHLKKGTKLTLKSMNYYKGYNSHGDTLFAALFKL